MVRDLLGQFAAVQFDLGSDLVLYLARRDAIVPEKVLKVDTELTEENYFKALELGLIPMDWIKRQATKGSDLLNKNDRVITYNGSLLDFRRKCNLEKDSQKVSSIEELKIA